MPQDTPFQDETPQDPGQDHPQKNGILAELAPSLPRRLTGAATLAALGALLVYLALWQPPVGILWQVFLLGFGAGALFLGVRVWQATAVTLELTRDELRERGGRSLVATRDIRAINRGVFAFKPSNGFLINMKTRGPRVWAPGLWWRFGRQLGVGGVTSGQGARNMADAISLLLNERR